MFPRPQVTASATLFVAALLLSPPCPALTVLGTGPAALLGGDLTDPENDGDDTTATGFDWLSTAASSENNFGSEGALDVFDNQVGAGSTKWCCDGPPQWVAVELDRPYVLTHFTIASGNDVPERDPTEFTIEGSGDGATWTTIFHWNAGTSPFSQRLEVIRFDGNGADFATPAPYPWIRYHCLATDGGQHQINELEFFGVPVQVINDFATDKPLIPPAEPITLSWVLDPGVTAVSIDNGVGDVMGDTTAGVGSVLLDPGPVTTTTYTLTAVHPEATARQSLTVTVTDQPVIQSFTSTPEIIAPGGSSTLQWDVLNTTSLDLNGTDVTGMTSTVVSPSATTTYTLTATNTNGTDTAHAGVVVVVPGQPLITEFMADNDGTVIVDEDGDSSDWIEIHNPSATTAILTGYYLTDDPLDLQKWAFPAVNLDPQAYLVVFASAKNRATPGSELHTNFGLDAGGDYLALVKPDGVTIVTEFGTGGTDFPDQEAGISYGTYGDPPATGYLETATPGTANGAGFLDFVADTKFSINRGFFTTPQSVAITTTTPGASIRYTTDGSWPSETTGTLYSGPVTIARTTPLRAIAFKAGHRSTNVDTHTYIFVDDVVSQSATTTQTIWGLPSSWDGVVPDYGMDPDVTTPHAATIRDDLKTVPTLSIVIDNDDMFGTSGIYSHPTNSGEAWERASSLELIDPALPDGSNNFQLNCGLRIQGGAFRSFNLTKKKSFRVLFKDLYGPTKLRYPFFGDGASREFDTLVFRMESNDGYQWGDRTNVQYARDEFGRRTQLDMGSPSAHGRFMHIYINGVYWGLYNTIERPDASFGRNYFGANKDEWDSVNSGTATNEGSTASWNTLKGIVDDISGAPDEATRTSIYMEAQGLHPDGSPDPAKADFIDIDNYIDYLLVNWYTGNNDWPHKNYYHGRERDLLDPPPLDGSRVSIGTHFFSWDAEWSLFLNSNNDLTGDYAGVAEPYSHLRNSREFRVRFGDRAHRALFNNGALTPQKCLDRYAEITRDHTSILIPELARWGDQHTTLRTLQNWIDEYNHISNGWLAVRTPAFLTVLRGANLYPDLGAPVFSQHGGPVSPATPVTLSSDADTIYYTTDGSDPRSLGGGVAPGALAATFDGSAPGDVTFVDTGHVWKFRDLGTDPGAGWDEPGHDDSLWQSGPSSLGYGSDGEGAGTTVSYGPDSQQKYAATYFRTTIDVPDPGVFDQFLLRIKYDDAVAFYVNGTPVVLTTNLPNGVNSAYDEYATAMVANENAWKDYVIPGNLLNPGPNTLAAQIHQVSPTSSDIRFDVVLRGEVVATGGGNVSDPIYFADNTVLKARSHDSSTGEWSALNEALFTVNVVGPDTGNLVISEFNYHPNEPVLPGEIAISTDRDDYEFIEFMNVGASTIDLSGVSFGDAITFSFPDLTFLYPGERVLIVRHLAAFTERYGTAIGSTPVAGQYSGRLSNDGEHVLVSGPLGDILDFTYNDQPPWPTAADGEGASLVLVAPLLTPDHNDPANWRASTHPAGSPGTSDSITLADWMTDNGITDLADDPDHDGISNFGEFAMGTAFNDTSSRSQPAFDLLTIAPDQFAALELRLSLAAMDEVEVSFESSPDMQSWTDATSDFVYLGEVYHGDGTITVTYHTGLPVTGDDRGFYRVRFRQR